VDKTYDYGVKPAVNTYDRMNANPQFSPTGKPASAPPVPPKPNTLQTNFVGNGQSKSPISATRPIYGSPASANANGPPGYNETIAVAPPRSPASAPTTPSSAKAKRPWLNRIALAGEVVLTSLESSAHELINTGTAAASSAAG